MTETNWRHKTLPDSFKAINNTTNCVCTCDRTSETTYRVGWSDDKDLGQCWTHYGEGALKEIIYRDKSWSITRGTTTVKQTKVLTLEKIKQFCNTYPLVDVIASSNGFQVIYSGDCDDVFVNTDEQLLQVFGALEVLLHKGVKR